MHTPTANLLKQSSPRMESAGDNIVHTESPIPIENLRGKKIIFAANTSWYLYNHHRNILAAFLKAGCRVFTVTPTDAYSAKLATLGCETITLPLIPSSKNPIREAFGALSFFRIYHTIRPDAVVHFTIKCNLYGGLAAGSLDIPHINTICGLGSAFERENLLNKCVQAVYRLTQRRSATVFFQSPADLEYMRERGLVSEAQALLLPGSGVDLKRFLPVTRSDFKETAGVPFRFVFAARLLRDKGLSLLATAMREVQATYPGTECRIYGFLEPGNARYVTRDELEAWESEGLIKYYGPVEDVGTAYAEADCVVLPTYYREGVPKSLLEAAAMGKPIVTTTLVGCKAVVEDSLNGLLCEPRDLWSLVNAMQRMIEVGPAERARMGMRGRERMEGGFGEERVIGAYLNSASGMLA